MSSPGVWQNDDRLEEEWEYEYDDDETEDLYFALDLTTHVPDAIKQGKVEDNDEQPTNETTSGPQYVQTSLRQRASASPQGDQAGPHEIQILDLHTANPLVRLDNGVYSCYWSTDLGTQFHVAKAGAVDKPCHAGNVLDVIGITQARLLGKPVSLQVREGHSKETSETATPEHVIDVDSSPDTETDMDDSQSDAALPASNVLPAPGEPLVIPRTLCKTTAGEDQASFLERFSAIKVKKGEYDPIAIHGVKLYNTPSAAEQEVMRKQALEDDAVTARGAKSAKEAPAGVTPRKRRRRRANPEVQPDENTTAQQYKRMYGRSGRIPDDDVRAGLGYQLEAIAQDDAPSEKDD